jgi:citrate synthase
MREGNDGETRAGSDLETGAGATGEVRAGTVGETVAAETAGTRAGEADGTRTGDPADTLTVDEAARRLGVRRETVYAYVSRGLLPRHSSSARRATRFSRDDVERLAGRARRTDRSPAVEPVVDTELTLLDPAGRLSYRGHDAVDLARHAGFERTTALLWGEDGPSSWDADPTAVRLLRGVVAPLADAADPAALLPVVVAALRAADGLRADRRPDAVRRAGRSIVATFVDALPAAGEPVDRRVAARLWTVLTTDERPPGPAQLRAVDAALVLLADHELAASTFAARVAASAWADPYGVVLTGLGPLGGALHGAASADAERLLVDAAGPAGAARALGERLGGDGPPAGFGHRVYRDRDPRADHLLGLMPGCALDAGAARAVTEVVAIAAGRGLPAPNVDLALAGLSTAMRLRPGSASTIFAVARVAGLVAHGLEEYRHRLRFRPRATYVGELPR